MFKSVKKMFTHIANARYCHARTNLNNRQPRSRVFFNKNTIVDLLLLCSFGEPLPVVKHQDVGPKHLLTLLALRQRLTAHQFIVNFGNEGIFDDDLTGEALQVMDASMHLQNVTIWIPCCLEMSVYVRSHCKVVALLCVRICNLLGYIGQQAVAFVRHLFAIHRQSRSVKPPKQVRLSQQKGRIGAFVEAKLAAIGRVVVPKPFVSSEIRKPWVLAHPRPSRNQEGVRTSDEIRSSLNRSHLHCYLINLI